jgi:hypothetical protein
MTIQIRNPELQRHILEQVDACNFQTPEAVVEDALLRVMMGKERELTDEDIAAIQLSDEQFEHGEGVDAAEARKQIRRLGAK